MTKAVFLITYAFIALLLLSAYIWVTLYYRRGWLSTLSFQASTDFQPTTSISVIIPARNEAANINACLQSILAQNYPHQLMEIIVVDDHSEDETAELVKAIDDPRLTLLSLADHIASNRPTNSYKKKAINLAIEQANSELIITTDADCWMKKDWLRTIAAFYQVEHPVMIAAPVLFYSEKTAFQLFQSLDFTGMMAVTAAGIRSGNMHLANGANLCYQKESFNAVNGFEGIDKLASGDDLLLMQKMVRQFPGEIAFCKSQEATVYTIPQPEWKSFLQQRLRWATKSTQYPDWRITLVLAIVFFLCWGIILSFLLSPFLGKEVLLVGLIVLLGKSLVDYFLLRSTTSFFHREDLMRSFLISQFYHICYIAVIGLLANLRKEYEWKGRKTS